MRMSTGSARGRHHPSSFGNRSVAATGVQADRIARLQPRVVEGEQVLALVDPALGQPEPQRDVGAQAELAAQRFLVLDLVLLELVEQEQLVAVLIPLVRRGIVPLGDPLTSTARAN
jgi:hypothetical protein